MADWRNLGGISAYHVAEAGRPYPPILLATSRRDVTGYTSRPLAQDGREAAGPGVPGGVLRARGWGHGYGKDNARRPLHGTGAAIPEQSDWLVSAALPTPSDRQLLVQTPFRLAIISLTHHGKPVVG